jgi:hypothetical protein
MINWDKARNLVSTNFFGDKISIYEMGTTENKIGEETESETLLVDDEPCNVQNNQSQNQLRDGGASTPQGIRISLRKDIPLVYDKRYRVVIKEARLGHTGEHWSVAGWTEGQISTVIICDRRVTV